MTTEAITSSLTSSRAKKRPLQTARWLRRIRYIVENDTHANKGELGGWIESEENLRDWAWVTDEAIVFGEAIASDDAKISGRARVFEKAQVSGCAEILDNAKVFGKAEVSNCSKVQDITKAFGSARIGGDQNISEGNHY